MAVGRLLGLKQLRFRLLPSNTQNSINNNNGGIIFWATRSGTSQLNVAHLYRPC